MSTWYRDSGKRCFDLAVSIPSLVCLFPLMTVIGLLVRITMGSPILFRQQRPGLNALPFTIYKFRTMTDERHTGGKMLSDGQRLTRLGRFLRRASLDELPELLNVLKGDMSLVGPRPLLMRYMPYYKEWERKRFCVLPGITGWAQVNGRNDLAWDDRLASDTWYAENVSAALDMRILLLTFLKVVRRENVRVVPNATMRDLDQERL